MFYVRLFVCLSALFVASCASIPLSTMAKMAMFDEQDFANLDPADIRVRVMTLDPLRLRQDSLKLQIDVKDKQTKQPIKDLPQGEFKLQVVSHEPHTIEGGLFSSDVSGERYVLAMSKDQYEVFRAYQAFAVKKDNHTKFHGQFGVSFDFEKLQPPDEMPSESRLWVDLKLTHDEPFMTLMDGATLTFD